MILLPQQSWEVRNTKKKGRGLFAKKNIEAGSIISDYIGKVISPKEENKYDNRGHFYLMYYHHKASLYPLDVKKDGAHVINHSCTPNAWMYTYKRHTLFFAIRKIFKGEEITINYLLPPQDKSCNPCKDSCYCGSIICSQTMHMSKKRFYKWSEIMDKEEKATPYPPSQYGKILPLLDSYPHSIADNTFYTLFGSTTKKPFVLKEQQFPSIEKIRAIIRDSGRTILVPKLGIHILGTQEDIIFSQKFLTGKNSYNFK